MASSAKLGVAPRLNASLRTKRRADGRPTRSSATRIGPVRITLHRDRAATQVRKHGGRDSPVIIDEVACRNPVVGAIALERAPFLRETRQFILSPATFRDPVIYAELDLVFAIAMLASVVPARRAMRVDPLVALRHE